MRSMMLRDQLDCASLPFCRAFAQVSLISLRIDDVNERSYLLLGVVIVQVSVVIV